MTDWKQVATALLGTWPSQVASWGREALAAYVAELEARGLTPDMALAWIRTTATAFPPSVGELAAAAQRDVTKPTFAEACTLIFGSDGVLRARTRVSKAWWEPGERDRLRDEAAWERAAEMHPLIGAFIRTQGLERLRSLNLDDEDWGNARREQLRDEWETFVDANDGRDVAALVARERGELRKFDPLDVLQARSESGPHLEVVKRAS